MSTNSIKILAVTGARSEYDLLSPLYQKLSNDSRFSLQLLVTGSHLNGKFGNTIDEIIKDGYEIVAQPNTLVDTEDESGRIQTVGNQILSFTDEFSRIKPDIVLIAGDREEAISTTMTCAFLGICVAHFFGGDVVKDGNIDNSIRYASSKFAHLHFVALEEHKSNLLRLGEDESRIFNVGSPSLDKFILVPQVSKEELSTRLKFNISDSKYLLLIQHSIIDEIDLQSEHIRETLKAIEDSGMKCLINYPNSDAGNQAIINAYNECVDRNTNFFVFKNLDRETFVNVMRHASCLVGNSSSGIHEAPSLGLPVVNVGSRQRGRIHGKNVIFTNNDSDEILIAIKKSVEDLDYIKVVKESANPYGDGNSSDKIIDVLSRIEIDKDLIYKNITY